MSLFECAFKTGMMLGNKRFIPGDLDSFYEFLQLIRHTRKELRIITGELDPKFFERREFIEVIRFLLEQKKVEISIVFNKTTPKEIASLEFQMDNPSLFELKSQYIDQLKVYWSPLRPEAHYAIVDDRHLFLEGVHVLGEKKDTFFLYNRKDMAKKWTCLFNQYISQEGMKEI